VKIELSSAILASPCLILTAENYADVLQIRELREVAKKNNIDVHDWHNENGKGMTFFLGDRNGRD
jgi:hypothetical protein